MRDDCGQRIESCGESGSTIDTVTDGDGDVIWYECPDCSILKKTSEKARAHCTPRQADDCSEWGRADFANPESDVWPTTLVDHRCWMVRRSGSKQPFAPWGSRAHPDVDDEKDVRYSWSVADNWTDKETADEWVEMHPDLEGHAVILDSERDPYTDEPDPFALVDGDNVRCPETGDVHPAFIALLDRLGLTYADVSRSASGVHALYEGQLFDDVKRAAFAIDDEPWGANDEAPGVEIYDGKRVCVVTGEHVPGTPDDVHPWDEDGLEAILDEHVPEADRHTLTSHDTVDPLDDYEPTITGPRESTTEIRDVFYAVENLRPADLPIRTSKVGEEGGPDGWQKWDPSSYRTSSGGDSLHRPPRENVFFDQKTGHTFGVLALFAAEQGIISKPWHDLSGTMWWEAVDAAREAGAPIPEHEGSSNREGQGEISEQYAIERCSPPVYDSVSVDREQQWAKLRGPRLDDWLARSAGTLEVWGDDPGEGKTTSAPLGLVDRDESHVLLLPQHENGYEFTHDPAKPDGYYHHKGGGQPREDCCMKAQVEADENDIPDCPTHGHPSNWPRMCPIHAYDKDDPVRAVFEAIEREVGTERAHELVDPHDGEKCAWQCSHNTLANAERVVTVQNYLTQKTVQDVGKVLIDDLQQLPIDARTVSIPALLAAANRMDAIGQVNGTPGMLAEAARFVRDVVDLMTGGFDDDPNIDGVEDLAAPEIPSDEVRELREYQGTNFQHSRVIGHAHGEPIARAKVAYNETVINRMRDGRWEAGDELLCFDAVIALAAQAGLDTGPAYRAIAVPTELDSCPICTADLSAFNGRRVCKRCGWDEESGLLVRPDDEAARVQARLVPTDENDGSDPVVEYQTLPMPSELPTPEDTLVLDATPTPDVIGALFALDPEDIVVTGNEPRKLNATVTQVSNGQYHRSTIGREDEYGERLREKIQRWIDQRSETCDQFLVVGHKSNRRYYDLPDNAEWMHFHAARGLDREEYEGVIVIGSPHPNVEALRRDAELLALHRDDVRVGGEEHSTRADAPNPPVYRKLLYRGESGEGRAVPTKHYTGLVGSLFRAGREDELVQVAHRIRPGQADPDDEKFIDLLTNVPIDLPVDQFVQLEELTEPLSVILPVPDGAVRLLGYTRDVLEGDGPDGFRLEALVEQRDDETIANKVKGYHYLAQLNGEDVKVQTVYNWIHALEEVSLLTPEGYEQRRGVSYSADLATLKSTLQVLSSSDDFKVAPVRRFCKKVKEANGSLDWLAWAEAVFDLAGDRCEWDPPSTPRT